MEHSIVNKYSDMINEEVSRYKNEMLDYFHARPVDKNKITDKKSLSATSSSSSLRQYYTTSLTRTTYELEGYVNEESDFIQQTSTSDENDESKKSTTIRRSSDNLTHSKSVSYEPDPLQIQTTFLTENFISNGGISTNEIVDVPFYDVFQVPTNLANSLTFK